MFCSYCCWCSCYRYSCYCSCWSCYCFFVLLVLSVAAVVAISVKERRLGRSWRFCLSSVLIRGHILSSLFIVFVLYHLLVYALWHVPTDLLPSPLSLSVHPYLCISLKVELQHRFLSLIHLHFITFIPTTGNSSFFCTVTLFFIFIPTSLASSFLRHEYAFCFILFLQHHL